MLHFKNNFIGIITTLISFINIAIVLILEKPILFDWITEDQITKKFSNDVANTQQYLCDKNPFASSLKSPLIEISQKVDDWVLHKNKKLIEIMNVSKNETGYNYHRFKAFEIMAECNNEECIGGPCLKDGSKFLCGSSNILNSIKNCVVYSFGSNDEWSFEIDIIQRTTNCEVHVFDCTGSRQRFHMPLQNPRLTFHHICLGNKYAPAPTEPSPSLVVLPNFPLVQGEFMTLHEIQKMLNHEQVHLLKVDVEGYEWSIFESWTNNNNDDTSVELPWQIITEVHYATWLQNKLNSYNETDMIELVSHLHQLGYATVIRENNLHCEHCCEITLVRYNHCKN